MGAEQLTVAWVFLLEVNIDENAVPYLQIQERHHSASDFDDATKDCQLDPIIANSQSNNADKKVQDTDRS